MHLHQSQIIGFRKFFCVQTGGKSRIACLRVEMHAANCASATQSGEMLIPPETWLPAANYALAHNATFSTNLGTKRRVYLLSDMVAIVTSVIISTMSPLIHNLLLCASGA